MKKTALSIAALLCAAISLAAAGVSGAAVDGGTKSTAGTLTGAGATFPYPLISKWIPAYDQAAGTQVNYSPIGSGGGIAAITARTVDFGASDAPLSPDQFTACKGCVQIPWALSATAVIYNVPGAPQGLKLTPALIAQIYLGFGQEVELAGHQEAEPEREPARPEDHPRLPVRRLGHVVQLHRLPVEDQPDVEEQGRHQHEGQLADRRRRPRQCRRYRRRHAHRRRHHLRRRRLRAREQAQVRPGEEPGGSARCPGCASINAAAASVDKVTGNGEISIVNPAKSQPLAYPISTFTYVLAPTASSKAAELRKFIYWAITAGQKFGPPLLFAPLPKPRARVQLQADQEDPGLDLDLAST